jgi:hypothetical protein
MHQLERSIQEWVRDADTGREIEDAYRLIRALVEELFSCYEPVSGERPDFWEHFAKWINNVNDEKDQKSLFRMVSHILFIGREEFETLYRVAYRNQLPRWLITKLGIQITDGSAKRRLEEAATKTWICPISDSMRINAFYHVNRIAGFDHRPDWRSMSQFGDIGAIERYLDLNGIEYLVLIEDFVGSGTQMLEAVRFASRLKLGRLPILVIPLVICPDGVETARRLEQMCPQVSVEEIVRIRPTDVITPAVTAGEPIGFGDFRELANRTYPQVCGGTAVAGGKPYGPFGYRDTGALVVMYSNCPDNTLPIIHHESALWRALFARATRV